MSEIRDVLFIKSIERSLGRKLSQEELDTEERDGELQLNLGNGEGFFIQIPRLKFPHDLLSDVTSIPGPSQKLVRVPELEGWQIKKNFKRNVTMWELVELYERESQNPQT